MLAHIKQFFAPPVFGDADKTHAARVLNTLLMASMLVLIFLGGVAVPFLFGEKRYNLLFVLALLLVIAIARWLMRRGHMRPASILFASTTWILVTIVLFFAGGAITMPAVFYLSGTVITGLLLGTRAALIHAGACSLAGLAIVVLGASDRALPRLFPVPPLAGWVDLTVTLLLTVTVLSLTLRSLNDALALARRRLGEREQAEASLRQRERDFVTLVENATDLIVRFGADLNPVYCNPAVERQLGVPVRVFLEKTPLELEGPGEPAELIDRSLRKALETGQEQQVEHRYAHPSGLKHFQTRIVPELGADGRVETLLAVSRDITDLKRTEKALQESEERYRGLFEGVPVGLYRTTPEGEILDANSALVGMLGYPDKGSLLAISMPAALVNREDRRRWRALMERKGAVRGFEVQMRRHDGAAIWVRGTAHTVRDQEGRVLYYQGSLEDITDRRKAELERERLRERLIQVQKTEAIGRLAGGIAHDFNNVLTAIQGYGQFLLDNLTSDDPRDWPSMLSIRTDLREILDAADRAAALTHQLLAFSRKQILQPRVLSLNDLLHGMENLLGRLLGEDIDLITILAPDLGHVRADPGQIEQVIMNLSVNARDAMPRGGKLTFETANVELDEAYAQTHPGVAPGSYALLAVSDNGVGMSNEVKAHLFEPFFTTKEQGRGTGLGLATIYGIVEQSGGHIEVYSELGVGTMFKVYLPLTQGTTTTRAPRRSTTTMPPGVETILLAEDEPSVRDMISRVLDRCGYTVLMAGHPHEAMALSAGHSGDIQLLITDVIMPEMGGKDLAQRLVSSRPQMKVLYISGYTDDAIVHHGVLEAGVAYLGKPFTPTSLAHKVREMLDSPS